MATHVSWWIMVGLGVMTLVLAFVTTSAWGLATAGRVADEFRDIEGPPRGRDAERRDDSATVVVG
jgi:hypothetical protein